jgi:hypothetical protein
LFKCCGVDLRADPKKKSLPQATEEEVELLPVDQSSRAQETCLLLGEELLPDSDDPILPTAAGQRLFAALTMVLNDEKRNCAADWGDACETACWLFREHFLFDPVVLREAEAYLRLFSPPGYVVFFNFLIQLGMFASIVFFTAAAGQWGSFSFYQQVCFAMLQSGGLCHFALNCIAVDYFSPASLRKLRSGSLRAIMWEKMRYSFLALVFIGPPIVTHCLPALVYYFPVTVAFLLLVAFCGVLFKLEKRWFQLYPEWSNVHRGLVALIRGYGYFAVSILIQSSFCWGTALYASGESSVLVARSQESGLGWPLDVPLAEYNGRSFPCKIDQLRNYGGFGYVTWVEIGKIF